jgi:hypothetical protein
LILILIFCGSEPARDATFAGNDDLNPAHCRKIPAKPTANPSQSPQSTGANKSLSYKE